MKSTQQQHQTQYALKLIAYAKIEQKNHQRFPQIRTKKYQKIR